MRTSSLQGPVVLLTTRLCGPESDELYVTFSHDGSLITVSGWWGLKPMPLMVWKTATGRIQHCLGGDSGYGIAFSSRGGRLATAEPDAVCLWDLASGEMIARFPLPERLVNASGEEGWQLRFDPEDQTLVMLTRGVLNQGRLRAWDLSTRTQVLSYAFQPKEMATDCAFTPNGLRAFTLCVRRGLTYIYGIDVPSGKRVFRVLNAGWDALTPNQRWMIVCTKSDNECIQNEENLEARLFSGNTYEVWDTIKGRRRGSFQAEPDRVTLEPVLLPNGRHALQVSQWKKDVAVWDVRAGMVISRFSVGHYAWPAIYAPKHHLVALVSDRDTRGGFEIFFCDPFTGKVLGRTSGHSSNGHTFSPCGRWFSSARSDNARQYLEGEDPVGTVYLTDLEPILPFVRQIEDLS